MLINNLYFTFCECSAHLDFPKEDPSHKGETSQYGILNRNVRKFLLNELYPQRVFKCTLKKYARKKKVPDQCYLKSERKTKHQIFWNLLYQLQK